MDLSIEHLFWVGFVGAALAFLFALIQLGRVLPLPEGGSPAQGLATALRKGTNAYLKWQLLLSTGFLLLCLGLLTGLYYVGVMELPTIGAFLSGSLCSLVVGVVSAKLTAAAGPRAADAAGERLDRGVSAALCVGSAVSFLTVSLVLVHLTGWFFFLKYSLGYAPLEIALTMLPFGLGSGLMTLLFHMGSLFASAAGLTQQMVDREMGLSPDSPQNPAAIALRVGHGVGAAAVTASGGHWRLECALLAAFALGAAAFTPDDMGWNALLFPLFITTAGVLCSILASLAVPAKEGGDRYSLPWSHRLSQLLSSLLTAVVSFPLSYLLTGGWDLCWAVTVGLLAGLLSGLLGEYFTADTYKPARSLAGTAESSIISAVTGGLGTGFAAGILPGLLAAGTAATAFFILGGTADLTKGFYGAALAGVGIASVSGIHLASTLCGPVGDNAAQTLSLIDDGEVPRRRADSLAALGAAAARGGECLDATLTALGGLSLLVGMFLLSLSEPIQPEPFLLCGILLGGLSSMLFLGLLLRGIRRAAQSALTQAQEQFRVSESLLESPSAPDYAACVKRCGTRSLLCSLPPFLLAVLSPLAAGFLLGPQGLLGFLGSLLLLAVLLSPALSLGGGILSGARRYVESGKRGGRGSDCHRSTIQAEGVVAPLRDVAAPALTAFLGLAIPLSLTCLAAIEMFNLPSLLG